MQLKQKLHEKEAAIKASKAKKEISKKDDKSRQALRRDVAAEQKKARAEALSEVLSRFDNEEDTLDLQGTLTAPAVAVAAFAGSEGVSTADLMADPRNNINLGGLSGSEVENVLDVTACLQAHQGYFKLPTKVHHLDNFLECLVASCATAPWVQSQGGEKLVVSPVVCDSTAASDVAVKAESELAEVIETSEAMEVSDTPVETTADPATCVESKEGDVSPPLYPMAVDGPIDAIAQSKLTTAALYAEEQYIRALRKAESELDRVQLNLLFPVVQELNTMLELSEPDGKAGDNDSNLSRREKKNVLEHTRLLWSLPINQLTWTELSRMCIIMRIGQELGKSDEEVKTILHAIDSQDYFTHFFIHIMAYFRYKPC